MARLGVYVVVILVTMLLPACKSGDSASITGCERYSLPPVLFVHGSGLSAGSWKKMIRYLESSGYPTSYLHAVNLKPYNGDNIRAAEEQLHPAADALLATAGASFRDSSCTGEPPDRIAIVAHSMGSVSGRWYATRIAPEKVSVLISLAGSNHGTDELCGLAGRGNAQMCPAYSDSPELGGVQALLNGTATQPVDETPYGVGPDSDTSLTVRPDETRNIMYLTVYLEPDRWIKPTESALLDGAGSTHDLQLPGGLDLVETNPGNYRFPGRSSHDGFPEHRKVCRFVLHALTNWVAKTTQ